MLRNKNNKQTYIPVAELLSHAQRRQVLSYGVWQHPQKRVVFLEDFEAELHVPHYTSILRRIWENKYLLKRRILREERVLILYWARGKERYHSLSGSGYFFKLCPFFILPWAPQREAFCLCAFLCLSLRLLYLLYTYYRRDASLNLLRVVWCVVLVCLLVYEAYYVSYLYNCYSLYNA